MKISFKLYFAILTSILVCNFSFSQNKKYDIDGAYSSGEAGFIIQKDKTFMVIAMGTLIKGTWEIDKDVVTLTPKNPDAAFYLYARKKLEIKSGMRIMYLGDDYNSDVFVGEFPNKMKAVYNENSNCYDYPAVSQAKELPTILTFIDHNTSDNPYQAQVPELMYDFKTDGYNDFVAQYMSPKLYHNPFQFKIVKDGLLPLGYGDEKPMKKEKLEDSFGKPDEIEFLKTSFDLAYDAPYKLVNNAYNTNDDMKEKIDLSQYKYDAKRNVYVNSSVPAKNLNYQNGDYHNLDVLMKFDRIPAQSKAKQDFSPISGSMIIANCK